jgi:hypothetical protein
VLQNELGDAVWFPSLAFSAYHPDLILISDPTRGNQLVNCATGPYHSALALFAYRAGWPAEAALRLYRREVFAALGYFQVWRGAAEALLDQGRQFGLDLSADFLRWANRGCFMYSINHPKPHVLYDIARKLLRGVGLTSEPIDFDTYAVDDIVRGYVFPVYPEIAEFYGVSGSYIFKPSPVQAEQEPGKILRPARLCRRLLSHLRGAPAGPARQRARSGLAGRTRDHAAAARFRRVARKLRGRGRLSIGTPQARPYFAHLYL